MKTTNTTAEEIQPSEISLRRMGDSSPAGLWIASLPWPRKAAEGLSLNGAPTHCRPLGQWYDCEDAPRRLLLIGDAANTAPDELNLVQGTPAPATPPPEARMELFAQSPDPHFGWERHRLVIKYQGRSVAFTMGLRSGEEWHWWEACRLVKVEETATCLSIEMGGAIPLQFSGKGSAASNYLNPLLHKHHWLYGHISARLHANGVCEIFARHINSKYVDDGADLKAAVPVVGISGVGEVPGDLLGAWDGRRRRFQLGDVAFDVTEAAKLATPLKPGRMDRDGDTLVWQPYQACELYGGACATQRSNSDGYILHAADETILRGMSRTIRFSISLSDRSPTIKRYQAPNWWYGLCEEFSPRPLLPVFSGTEDTIRAAQEWVVEHQRRGGFEDGEIPRNNLRGEGQPYPEPGWEGEIPYAVLLSAWRYGDADLHERAMSAAYHFSDVVVDHAANLVRMHGFPPIAFALPMNRIHAVLGAYLETGDNFLLDTAEKVVEAAHRLQHNAWPRLAVGRDSCYARGAALIYRYTGKRHFREIAHRGAMAVVESQRENGSFGDQGGGTGVHQWGSYITKPWMGLLATGCVLDYIELIEDNPRMVECIKRFADWMLADRFEHRGRMHWFYQHDFWGRRSHQQNNDGPIEKLPGGSPWHQDNIGRLMAFCTRRYNDNKYLNAWIESRDGIERLIVGDHTSSASMQFLPWVAADLWQASYSKTGGLSVVATNFGELTFKEASISTPAGIVSLAWRPDGGIDVTGGAASIVKETISDPNA